MGAHLTYRPREGVIFGTVAGRSIRLATMRNQPGMDMEAWRQSAGTVASDVMDWPKMQELRTGRISAAAPGNRLKVAGKAVFEVYDYPGEYAQRFDGVDPGRAGGGPANHWHHGRVVWVKFPLKSGFPSGGFYLHGPPPCGNPKCIVIVQDWDALFQSLKTARQMTLFVEI